MHVECPEIPSKPAPGPASRGSASRPVGRSSFVPLLTLAALALFLGAEAMAAPAPQAKPGGKVVFSKGGDGVERQPHVWDVPSGRLRGVVPVRVWHPLPDGTALIQERATGLHLRWDPVTDAKALITGPGPGTPLTVSADGRLVVFSGHRGAVTVWAVPKLTSER